MKKKRKIAVLSLLAVICIHILILPAAATVMEHEGLMVTVVTDKEQYEPGEPITATLTVENTNSHTVTIASLEQLIPEGYQLMEGSEASTEDVSLGPNQTLIMDVTFVGGETAEEETAETDFLTNLIEGQTWGIPNLLILVVVVIAIIIFMLLT